MPLSLPSLSATTIRQAAKLMAAALRSKLPYPVVQQIVSNPALIRVLIAELAEFVGGDVVDSSTKRAVMAALMKQKRPDLANALAGIVKATSDVDVRELILYIENDGQLYRQQRQPIEKNLIRKWKKGQYDHAKAPKAWMYLVDTGAKKYMKEYGGPGDAFDKATRMAAAQEMADEWKSEMEVQHGPMGGTEASVQGCRDRLTIKSSGRVGLTTNPYSKLDVRQAPSKKQVRAGSWQEKAKAELEAELGGFESQYGHDKGRDYFTLEADGRADNGESEWMVFKDSASAERYAVDYVEEMLNDDPSTFNQDFLKQHVYVSQTDIRLIAGEEADNYLENIEDEDDRVLQEAGMSRQYESLQDKVDKLEEQMLEEMDPKKTERMQKQIEKLQQGMDKLRDKATSKVLDDYAREITRQLKDDPMEWAEELGYDFGRNRPPWLQIDTRKAAEDAVNTDGVAHFLDHYDGEELELPSGAVAFGTN